MPRSMWKGAISFGLVTIPVSVYPATEEKTLRFNQLHDEDGGRIRMKRTCSVDGEEVTYDHIVKGYEYEKDKYVVLTDDDFDAVPVASSRAIDIVQFVDLEDIDPILYKKTYYLIPEETGAKAYALLREAMSQVNKVGIAKVSFRDKEHLSALRFKDDAFVLETMYWPDEIREADFGGVDVDATVRDQELDMAKTLIENLTADWNPDEFTDEYREALLKIVEAKIAGEEIEFVEAEPTAKVVDLMAALKASVDAAKKRPDEEAAAPKASARKSSAKKSAAKKTTTPEPVEPIAPVESAEPVEQTDATALLVRAARVGLQKSDDEWVHSSSVKSQMQRMAPEFKEKALGYPSFRAFVESRADILETKQLENGQLLVRLK